ncbi:hypothetical protein [Paracoccus marinaquae]|uniref:Uncharacterized protein n=1 Tax=Paracoccus marinaquae TaxID=2841926 RepID=A0ABS6ALH1_9RHOB|nr:hypothetical protein [Paracoccus marinaquae]MBU3031440.1 hypothetical protein [Paracoccus marinaquae]
MIELLFVTCLVGAPEQCRHRSLLFSDDTGLMTCLIHGQTQLAGWIESHPTEHLREWRCRMGGSEGLSI